jgi:hypothetical protein
MTNVNGQDKCVWIRYNGLDKGLENRHKKSVTRILCMAACTI